MQAPPRPCATSPAQWQPPPRVQLALAAVASACLHEHVNAIVIEVRRGRDGKLYPPGGDLPEQERWRAIRLVHNLVHRDHLSIRAAQRVMLGQYAIRRSLGMLHRDLTGYACPVCDPGAFTRD